MKAFILISKDIQSCELLMTRYLSLGVIKKKTTTTANHYLVYICYHKKF